MSLVKLFDNIWYIPGATNTGLLSVPNGNRNDLYLVDSGRNRENGREILESIENEFHGNYNLKAIINTHSHADHSGGNCFIHEKTGSEIWISEGERGSLINPDIQAIVVWGGNPLSEIATPYLKAEKSEPSKVINDGEKISFATGEEIEIVSLPGHYFDQMGIILKNSRGEKAFFTGDALFGHEHIMKYWIPFIYDSEKFKESLDKINSIKAGIYIPSHGKITERIEETCEINKIAILSTEFSIMHVLRKKDLTYEEIVKAVSDINNITLKINQFALISCTLKAYITCLSNQKRISYYLKDNRMYYHSEEQIR